MLKIKYLPAVLLVLSGPAPVAAEELSETGQFLDGVAAVVNEGVVLKSQLDRQTELIEMRARDGGIELPPKEILEEQVLERLIIEEIQLQRAARIGVQISDQMLNTAIAQIAEQAGQKFEDLPAALGGSGKQLDEPANTGMRTRN